MRNIKETKIDWLDAEVKITYTEQTKVFHPRVEEYHGVIRFDETETEIIVDKVELILGDQTVELGNEVKKIIEKTFF